MQSQHIYSSQEGAWDHMLASKYQQQITWHTLQGSFISKCICKHDNSDYLFHFHRHEPCFER